MLKISQLKNKFKNNQLFKVLYPFYNYLPKRKIMGKNNNIENKCNYFPKIYIRGNNNVISVEVGCVLYNVKIYQRGEGCKLVIHKGCVIKNTNFYFEDKNGLIEIGYNTTIEGADISVVGDSKKVEIGDDCMFSSNILISVTDSHSILNEEGIRVNPDKNIIIRDHVWIGTRSIILKGVTIGHNSVVGASSLVTRNVENNSLVAGVPAKILKTNINWVRDRISSFN